MVAGREAGHTGADLFDHARGLDTGNTRQRQRTVKSRPHVDIVEVDADGCLPDAKLARPRPTDLDLFAA